MHFESQEELITALKKVLKQGVNVLVKGSRSAAMDQVVKHLMTGE